jgi:hypothetical protein
MGPDSAPRVGGNIKAPTKTRHVNPEYPLEAMAARVSGVVIMECRIEPDDTVSDVRILRSIPLLDDAAVAAVQQGIHADADEWRACADQHDGDGQLLPQSMIRGVLPRSPIGLRCGMIRSLKRCVSGSSCPRS